MNPCYICQDPLTETNKSLEHIIPNSIGGHLKSKEIICAKCNEFCGTNLDKVLSNFANIFASKLNIKRDRGSVPNVIATIEGTDEKVIVEPGWVTRKMNSEITKEGDKVSVSAGSRKRLLQEMKRLKLEAEKKGLKTDFTEPKLESINKPHSILFNISVNKDYLLRAVFKIIASFYVYKTQDQESVKEAGKFVKNGGNNKFIWFLDLSVNKEFFPDENNHIISITGCKNEKILYGYFELFGAFGVIGILTDSYTGRDIKLSYAIDPTTAKTKDFEVEIEMSKEQLINLIQLKPSPKS